ncbi:MAG: hypothetical protein IE917_11580 [Betaproteobacteria bacterium]|nr:hypothetical protein [Betaproteobacteria bacterium]
MNAASDLLTDEASSYLAELPAHHYGVHVENEMDARRLLYLVEQIGAAKVRGSAERYRQKYPDSRIFVSTLLKRYRVKVPARVYAPVNVPIYRVYLLLHPASGKLKIGYSGDWIGRAASFRCDFDLDQSIGISFHGDKESAKAAENIVKSVFQWASAEPPPVPFGAYGHTEWFNAVIYKDAVATIATFNTANKREAMTLREAIAYDIGREEPQFGSPVTKGRQA